MGAVQTPLLVLHFDGGADMVLSRDNYFQEPRARLMCLVVVAKRVFFFHRADGCLLTEEMRMRQWSMKQH
jgi:hypothetical protein